MLLKRGDAVIKINCKGETGYVRARMTEQGIKPCARRIHVLRRETGRRSIQDC